MTSRALFRGLFRDSPAALRQLVILLYSSSLPIFLVVLYLERDPDRGLWEIPAIAALSAAAIAPIALRREPRAHDWILPIALAPSASVVIAAVSCGAHGVVYLILSSGSLALAAVFCDRLVTSAAWIATTASCFAVTAHLYKLQVAVPLTGLFGLVHGAVAFSIHRKAQALRALRAESEARATRQQAVLSALPDTLVLARADGVFLAVHEPTPTPEGAGKTRLPLPAAELIGRSVYDVVSPDAAALLREALQKALDTGALQTVEYVMSYPDGVSRCYESRFVRSSPNEVVVLRRDVTERVAAERALRASEEQYRSVVDGIPEGVLVRAADGRLLAFNAAAQRILGCTKEDIEAGREPELLHQDGRTVLPEERPRNRALRTGQSVRDEVIGLRRRDGAIRWLLLNAELIRHGPGDAPHAVAITFNDITAKRREDEQLHRAQKMESIGRLAGTIAHDFNNLLTVIQSYGAMLESDLDEGDPRRDEVQEILAAAARATALTRRLLAASRRQIRTPSEVDLGEIVRSAEGLLRRAVGPGILVVIEPDEVWPTHLDRSQIEQILQNLAANSRAAMPAGGTFRVAVANVSNPTDPHLFGVPPPPGDYVVLTVSDTGKGFDPGTRERLFEPTLTTRDAVKTTGLGLAEVHGIVSQSRGHVAVQSDAGGTTFRLYFPRFRPAEAPASLREPPSPARGAEPTILVVDDDAEVRIVTRRLLSREGFHILEAADGPDALKVYSEHRDDIALILTDVAMPRLTGPELIAQIDASGQPRPPVIFMSAYVDGDVLGVSPLPPASAFIAKPFDKKALVSLIRGALPSRASGASA